MARIKNATFVGNPPCDVDVDSPTFTRVLKNAIGDLALVYDKVTGLNTEAQTMTHNGTRGRGARLGVPWINQTFSGRDDRNGMWGIDLSYTDAGAPSAPKDAAPSKDTIIFGVPVFVPPGEQDMTIAITGTGLSLWPWRMQLLLESTGAELFKRELTFSKDSYGIDQLTMSTDANGTGGEVTGKLCLLLIFADTTQRQLATGPSPDGQIRVHSLFAGPARMRAGTSAPLRATSGGLGYNMAATTPAPFNFRNFDETLLSDRKPLHSYLTGGAGWNLNALIEYITGWPVGGSLLYTLEDSATANPATSRFLAHTRSALSLPTTEPEVAWPLMAQAFGAAVLNGNMVVDAVPPTSGLLDWYAYMPVATASSRFVEWRMQFPDFDTSSSKLKCCTLAMSDVTAQGALWSSRYFRNGGAMMGAAAFAQVSTTKLMTSKATAMTFNPDAENSLQLHLEKSAAKLTADEMCVMGTCLYFEP